MERLNEIMGRAVPRRPANPTQPSHPYQGQDPASQSSQTEPVSQPNMRRRLPGQASQPLPPNASTPQNTTYPYGNDGNAMYSRPDQQQYNSYPARNQRPYREEMPNNRSNGSVNSVRPYAEQNESGVQTFTRDPYGHSRPITHAPNGRRGDTNDDNNIMYTQNTQFSTERPQHYTGSQPKQEPYFHHADVNNSLVQPESDVLNEEEIEDEEELHMGYGDWEEDNNQTLVYRRSDLEAYTPSRQSTSMYEAAPGYIEQPSQSIPPENSTRNFRDMRNDAGSTQYLPSPYNAKQPTRQSRINTADTKLCGSAGCAVFTTTTKGLYIAGNANATRTARIPTTASATPTSSHP